MLKLVLIIVMAVSNLVFKTSQPLDVKGKKKAIFTTFKPAKNLNLYTLRFDNKN